MFIENLRIDRSNFLAMPVGELSGKIGD